MLSVLLTCPGCGAKERTYKSLDDNGNGIPPPVRRRGLDSKAVAIRPSPEVAAEHRRIERERRSVVAEYQAAFEAGDFALAERHLLRLDPPARQPYLAFLLVDQGRWRDAIEALEEAPVNVNSMKERYYPILAVCHYRLGDVANGDRFAPRKIVDCGAAAEPNTFLDNGEVITDETPNQTPLDSPRKREAAAWHALAWHVWFGGVLGPDGIRAVDYSERAARMFPDVPAFTYLYAYALERAGYFQEALDWYRRCRQNARGMLVEDLGFHIYTAECLVERPPVPDKGRRP